jgi:hypothetical protein
VFGTGCFFFFDFSPIKVKLTEEKMSLGSFLTSACAIIGGVFTVSGLIDSFYYHGRQAGPSLIHVTHPIRLICHDSSIISHPPRLIHQD